MAFTHTFTLGVTTSGASVSYSSSYTGDGEINLDIAMGDSDTDTEVDLTLDVSQIKSIFMAADQDLTIETNSASAPDDTIALKANKPFVWGNDGEGYYAQPFSVDITDLFITNGSGTATTLKLRICYDATP